MFFVLGPWIRETHSLHLNLDLATTLHATRALSQVHAVAECYHVLVCVEAEPAAVSGRKCG